MAPGINKGKNIGIKEFLTERVKGDMLQHVLKYDLDQIRFKINELREMLSQSCS